MAKLSITNTKEKTNLTFKGSRSIRTQVNLYSFWSIRTQNFVRTDLVSSYSCSGQFVLIFVDSYSFWSIRSHVQKSTNLTEMSTSRPK